MVPDLSGSHDCGAVGVHAASISRCVFNIASSLFGGVLSTNWANAVDAKRAIGVAAASKTASLRIPSRDNVRDIVNKVLPGSRAGAYNSTPQRTFQAHDNRA